MQLQFAPLHLFLNHNVPNPSFHHAFSISSYSEALTTWPHLPCLQTGVVSDSSFCHGTCFLTSCTHCRRRGLIKGRGFEWDETDRETTETVRTKTTMMKNQLILVLCMVLFSCLAVYASQSKPYLKFVINVFIFLLLPHDLIYFYFSTGSFGPDECCFNIYNQNKPLPRKKVVSYRWINAGCPKPAVM